MKYRAVVDNKSRVLLIANDTGQKGSYNTIGKWCSFTIPTVPVSDLATKNPGKLLYKAVGKKIVPRTQKDLDKD